MSYSPTTDFLALLRQTSGGVRTERAPTLDIVLSTLARAGLFQVWVGSTAPAANQALTVWLQPAAQSWASEASVFLWDAGTGAYALATPALWAALLASASAAQVEVQDVTTAGPVVILPGASVVRVLNVGAPVTLTMPLSSAKIGPVLISDWLNAAGTNNIRVNLSGTDVFPGGAAFWTIAADAGSICLRPVPGGYAL